MLALDYSLARIETSESDVLELFESPPVAIKLAGSRPEPRTAYVCAVKKKAKVHVYVALAAEHGRNFVYTKSDSYDSEKTYSASLEEALAFARSLGFAPQRVDLNFSSAMRAVVVRNFKIFNTAGGKLNGKLTASGPSLAHEKALLRDQPASGSVAQGTQSPQKAAVAKAAAPAQGKEQKEQEEITAVLVKMGTELEALRAEKDSLLAQVQELSAVQLGVRAELNTALVENCRLLAERAALSKTLSEMENAASELAVVRSEVALLARERDEANQRHRDLFAENTALAEAVSIALHETAKLTEERDAALKRAEQISKDNGSARAEIEVLLGELRTVAAERDAAISRGEALEQQNAAKDAELDGVRRELTALRAERGAKVPSAKNAAALRVADAEKQDAAKDAEVDSLRDEVAALSAELAKVNSVAAERESAASGIRKLQQKAAAKDAEVEKVRCELKALASEHERVLQQGREQARLLASIEAKPAASSKVELPEPDVWGTSYAAENGGFENALDPAKAATRSVSKGSGATTMENAARLMITPDVPTRDFPSFSDLPQDDFFSAFSDGDEASAEPFLLQEAQTAVGYASAEDITELYKSYNAAHVAPDGKGQEACEGYICCLRKGDIVQVYVALVGIKSGKMGLYLSEAKSADQRAVAATVAGGVTFLEQVGLMTEPIDIESQQNRSEALKKCPVLKKK